MEAKARRGGKKNRKWGRESRRPSHARYLSEKRWITNKAQKIAKVMNKNPAWVPYNISVEVKRVLRDEYQISTRTKTRRSKDEPGNHELCH